MCKLASLNTELENNFFGRRYESAIMGEAIQKSEKKLCFK